ncbi:MarR family winged helix-turn-helix transcriptional regulator [Lacinutrix chionoecetis]
MCEKTDVIDRLIKEWKQEQPELDASAMAVVGRILKLGKTLEKRASQALRNSDIHYTDLDVLATLRRSGEPYTLSPKELMQSVLITSGAMTALLERLTKLKLIFRVPDENDGRIKRACLTKKGIQVIDVAIKKRFEEASKSIHYLSKNEKDTLSHLLKKMILQIDML